MKDLLQHEFGQITGLIAQHAIDQPERPALIDAGRTINYAALDSLMNRVACALQRDGVRPGEAIAICAASSIEYAAVFLGALRAGVVVAPLAPGSTPASLAQMAGDAQARLLFTDAFAAPAVGPYSPPGPGTASSDAGFSMARVIRIALDGSGVGVALNAWLAPAESVPAAAEIAPTAAFNIIYSSGTTGEPKGIVQSHGMRWAHVRRGSAYGYRQDSVTVLSTPLYSNTTLVVFFPTLCFGGCVVLMPKFDARGYLQLCQQHRATHTMLVPVQYQRLMALPDFDRFDLSSFVVKFSTSAPFGAAIKADVLRRWPGGLVEFYGMTEGGGTCILEAHANPDKLHTVGRPAEGHDIRLIDDEGIELPPGEAGEVVGHSAGMMTAYYGRPEKTREAEWFDAQGKRFIRTGDIGRFDADGFLTLFDRKKDMIISGGFNVYPSDLEAVLREHPAVVEAAVVGMPSAQWGETPVAFVVCKSATDEGKGKGEALDANITQVLLDWTNQRVSKTQRLSAVHLMDELPRSAIGKVLKRELRDRLVDAGG
jgi:acyl-CoA synthetase (AMP-forming)/AMP-acid ligase II